MIVTRNKFFKKIDAKKYTFLLPALLVLLNSCIGISADIQMRKDGSGKLTLEYSFSRMAEIIGRLDGNERWQILPAGRADLERTVNRISGMKLASFSASEQPSPAGNDKVIVNKAVLEFKNTEALLKFLDPAGKNASLSRENGANKLYINLNEGIPTDINTDLMDLMRQVSAGYKVKISFSAEGNSSMQVTDGTGKAVTPPAGAEIVPQGKKVSLSIGSGEIPGCAGGLGVIFSWE